MPSPVRPDCRPRAPLGIHPQVFSVRASGKARRVGTESLQARPQWTVADDDEPRLRLGGGTQRRADSTSSERLANEDVLKFGWIRAPVEMRMTHRLGPVPGDEVLPARLCETVQRQPFGCDRHFRHFQWAEVSTAHSYPCPPAPRYSRACGRGAREAGCAGGTAPRESHARKNFQRGGVVLAQR
jgi:hypothetical protein